MPGWLCDLLTSSGFGVFAGALLGALFGYGASWWHSRQETKARKALLFRQISDQLNALPPSAPSYDPSMLLTRGTVHISAVGLLLGTDVLDARKDARLMGRLVMWQSIEAGFNERVTVINHALVTRNIPPEHRSTWHHSLNDHYELLIALRDPVLSELPLAYQSPSWPQDPSKDQALLFSHRVDSTS